MGKLSRNKAIELLEGGTITQEAFDNMETAGQIAKQRGNTERVIKSKNNTWVTPMFYYKGLNGKERSKKMLELRDKVNQIIADYTISKSEVNQRSK